MPSPTGRSWTLSDIFEFTASDAVAGYLKFIRWKKGSAYIAGCQKSVIAVYSPGLAAVFDGVEGCPVPKPECDLLKTYYSESYIQGLGDFDKWHGVSSEMLYDTATRKDWIANMYGCFFVADTNPSVPLPARRNGWVHYIEYQPATLTESTMGEWGYMAGLLYGLEKLFLIYKQLGDDFTALSHSQKPETPIVFSLDTPLDIPLKTIWTGDFRIMNKVYKHFIQLKKTHGSKTIYAELALRLKIEKLIELPANPKDLVGIFSETFEFGVAKNDANDAFNLPYAQDKATKAKNRKFPKDIFGI